MTRHSTDCLMHGRGASPDARAGIEAIAADAIGAYRGPERPWPNALDDLEGERDAPFRSAYLGAAGVAWALDVLAREGLGPKLPGLAELADSLPGGFGVHRSWSRSRRPRRGLCCSGRAAGAGHGFASNACVLLAGRDLLGDLADEITGRIVLISIDRPESGSAILAGCGHLAPLRRSRHCSSSFSSPRS